MPLPDTPASLSESPEEGGAELEQAPPKPASPLKGELFGDLLSFFYPIHYRLGMDLETVMCQGRISRKQAAILWLVHTQVKDDGWVRRKEIEERLSTWFEISNSNISILLRELTKPPLSLLAQAENPKSGREKVVRLTEEGCTFVGSMFDASIAYLGQTFSHLTEQDLRQGVDFFELLFREQDKTKGGNQDD